MVVWRKFAITDLVKRSSLPRVAFSSVVKHPKYSLEGRWYDFFWEHLEFFFPSMPSEITEKHYRSLSWWFLTLINFTWHQIRNSRLALVFVKWTPCSSVILSLIFVSTPLRCDAKLISSGFKSLLAVCVSVANRASKRSKQEKRVCVKFGDV